MNIITRAASAGAAILSIAALVIVSLAGPRPTVAASAQVITHTQVVYRTRTITRWKTRTNTVTVTDPGALQCAEEEAAAITAMQDFMMANVVTGPDSTQLYSKVPNDADGFTAPLEAACVPYDTQLYGG